MLRGHGVVERLRKRLWRRSGAAVAARSDGERSASGGEGEEGKDQDEQAGGRKCAKALHGGPFEDSPSVVADDSERSVRAGSSIVKRDPSA